ncbi:MAG TPA: hypothetical protein VJB10_03410 [Candidatus Peribacteraceae bacterium]|nr:hypothetical protein [Candidatus Peribacteraceae bacterium]
MFEPRALSLAILSTSSILLLGAFGFLGEQILQHAPHTYTSEQYYERSIASADFPIDRIEELATFEEMEITAAEAIDTPPEDIDPPLLEQLNGTRNRIEDTYGVNIRMFNPRPLDELYNVRATAYSPSVLEIHLEQLERWLAKYPVEYVRGSGLQFLYLFKNWETEGIQAAGFLLDSRSIGISAVESVLHHELFHIMDITDGGIRNENYDWLQTKYMGGETPEGTRTSLEVIAEQHFLAERPVGFVSSYGKDAGVDEDQATIAAAMFTEYKPLSQWARNEPPLLNAVRFLQQYFYSRSDGKMDQKFWEKLESGDAFHLTYWEEREENSDFQSNGNFEEERLRYQKVQSARTFSARGQRPQAVQLLQQVTTDAPEATANILELGQLYESEQKYVQAIALYKNVLSAYSDPQIHARLAFDYAQTHQMAEALEQYRIARSSGALSTKEKMQLESVLRIMQK